MSKNDIKETVNMIKQRINEYLVSINVNVETFWKNRYLKIVSPVDSKGNKEIIDATFLSFIDWLSMEMIK